MTRSRFGSVSVPAAVFLAFASAQAVAAPGIVEVERIVTGPAPLDAFRRPVAVAVDAARGMLAVADAGNHRLVLFDASGRSRGTVVTPSDERGAGEPRAIAVDARGRLFVIDEITHRIYILNGRGSVLAELRPEPPVRAGSGTYARDIALGASGALYLLYAGAEPGILILDSRGRTVRGIGFGAPGSPFRAPVSLGVDREETRVAVTDPASDRQVLVLDLSGKLLAAFGEHEEAKGGFSLAVDVTWGPRGNLWVTDTIRHSISIFSPQGDHLGRMGGMGWGPGQFNYPAACEFLAEDRVVVVERAGARYQVLEVALPSPAETDLGSASSTELLFKEEDQL